MQLSRKTTATVAAVAIGASSMVATAPSASAQSGSLENSTVQYAQTGTSGSKSGDGDGSLRNPVVQGGLVVVAGLAVSAALAIGAGIRGGAFPIPQLP